MTLATIDIVIILAYILVVLYLGYRSSKKESSEGFLIADRKLGVFENAATIIASKTGAGLILTFVAFIYLFGISAMWFFVGASLGYVIFIGFASRLRKKSSENKYYTLSDYFFHRYGKKVGLVSAFVILVVMSLNFIGQLIGGAKVINDLAGTSFVVSLVIISSVILIYLILGGFKAVVKTDIAQVLALIIITGLLGFIMITNVDFTLQNVDSESMPLKSVIGFFILGIMIPFASAELWQRVYASKDTKSLKKSLILSAVFYFIIGGLFTLVGLSIRFQVSGLIDPDLALVQGFKTLLPPGLIGLGIVSIFAAVMSSADTYLFTNASILLQDFYAKFKIINDKDLVKLFRIALICLMIIAFIVSILIKSLINTALIFTGFASVIALTGMSSWIVRKIKGSTLVFGMVVGFLGTLIYVLSRPITETLVLNSIGFTILGMVMGSVMNWIRKRIF